MLAMRVSVCFVVCCIVSISFVAFLIEYGVFKERRCLIYKKDTAESAMPFCGVYARLLQSSLS